MTLLRHGVENVESILNYMHYLRALGSKQLLRHLHQIIKQGLAYYVPEFVLRVGSERQKMVFLIRDVNFVGKNIE